MGGGFNTSGSQPQNTVVGTALGGPQASNNLANVVNNDIPSYYQALEAQMPGYSNAATNAANQALGSSTAFDTGLYQQYAPLLNSTAQQLGASNLQSNANAIGSTLNSPGASTAVSGYGNLQSQLNPAYNSTMGNLASMMQNQNPNALSGSEQAQVERGLNSLNFNNGNQNVQSPLTSINNAATFGTALQNKQANFANLANSSANTANTLLGGQNSFGLTTGQPSGTSSANTSTTPNQFLTSPSTASGISSASNSLGQSLTGTLGSVFNTGNSAAAGQTNSGSFGMTGPSCCFIMILGTQSMPWYIRSMRDIAYSSNDGMKDGYTMMAQFLCPIMLWSSLVYYLVKKLMVEPMAEHSGYMAGVKGCKPRPTYYKFWRTIWCKLGGK